MRIAIDATPAAVQQAGVGRYTRELLHALLQLPDDDAYELLITGPKSSATRFVDKLPPGSRRRIHALRVSSRVATIGWHRLRLPIHVERIIGDFDVFHGPDFVLPPSHRPRVVTIHDLSFRRVPQYADPQLVRYLNVAVPRALDAADRIIAVSATVAAELVEDFPSVRDRVVAIPNGVRVVTPSVKPDSESRPIVLFLGTIEPRKGIDTLINAVRLARSTHPDLKLVIAGRIGWKSADIVDAIRTAEADGLVDFLEAPDDVRIHQAFQNALLFAYPSRYEGFGLPILEAMAHGVPVVASDIPVLRETGGSAATYAAPDDTDALANAICRLIEDKDLRETQIRRGLEQVATYSWQETARSTRRVYATVAERSG